MSEPASVMPPYQIAEATAIGTSVRTAPSRTRPAKGGTTARMPGRNRLMKMPATPNRRYSRSMIASERGASNRRPARLEKRRWP